MPDSGVSPVGVYKPQLDGLRALAITLVVIYHINPSLLPGGWIGVDVFFVLSGYLITSILEHELCATSSIATGNFYVRRVLRLTPAFWLLLAFVIFVDVLFSHKVDGLRAVFLSAAYLMNWNRAFGWYPQTLLGHTWSLAMEEQFYLVWPLILCVFGRRSPLGFILGAACAVVAWRVYLVCSGADPERTYNGFDTHSDALLIGCALAFAKSGSPLESFSLRFGWVPIFVILLSSVTLTHESPLTQSFGLTITALAAAWLLWATLHDDRIARLFSIKPAVYTGRISYGWYLWHYPIISLGAHLTEKLGHRALFAAASATLAFAIAALSHKYVEAPFLRMKARFAAKDQLDRRDHADRIVELQSE
jgi:peptidoglycan/LPS O-acetylase OafA/YrhL